MAVEENWTYLDSPWDLIRDCRNPVGESLMYCVLSHILGILSAYIFPIVSVFGIVTNCHIVYIFLIRIQERTRQMIYLASLAMSDTANLIAFGWFWVFPAKGLPYASNARLFFFTFNVSPTICRLHRFTYSFTSCLACNLFLLTALDRCLSIYNPIKFSRVRNKTAWISVAITTLISAILMIPFGVATGHIWTKESKIICWLDEGETFLQLYHVLFANCGFFQTIAIIGVNVALLIRLRQSARLRKELRASAVSTRKETAACMVLLILSSIFVVCSLPQSAAYMLAFVFQHDGSGGSRVRFAYNISDIGWHLFFIQESINWIVYMQRMSNFRRETQLCCGCCVVSPVDKAEQSRESVYTVQESNRQTDASS